MLQLVWNLMHIKILFISWGPYSFLPGVAIVSIKGIRPSSLGVGYKRKFNNFESD